METTTSRRAPSGILTLLWALFFFFVFALLITFWVRCSGTAPDTVRDQRASERAIKRAELDKADLDLLQGAGVINQEKGIAHIPLAKAKELTLAELQKKKVAPSQLKIEPRLPMPPPHDPNSPEPPPMALPSAPQGADTMHFDVPLVEAPAASDASTPDLEKSGGSPAAPSAEAPTQGDSAPPASPSPDAPPAAPSPESVPAPAPAVPAPAPAEPQARRSDSTTSEAIVGLRDICAALQISGLASLPRSAALLFSK
jgi:hypothetical protein